MTRDEIARLRGEKRHNWRDDVAALLLILALFGLMWLGSAVGYWITGMKG